MASRCFPPKILLRRKLPGYARPLNAAPSPISAVVPPSSFEEHKPIPETETLQTRPSCVRLESGFAPASVSSSFPFSNIDFKDHERLFASVKTTKLLRASANLQAAALEPMVDFGTWVLKSKMMEVDIARNFVMSTIRHTFYEHFCAGENTEEAVESVRMINETTGMRGMLVYGVEHTDDNASCDQNLLRFLETTESAKSLPPDYVSFVIAKITAMCPMNLLKRVSDLLRWQYKDPSFKLPWRLNTFPIFAETSALYHTLEKPSPLTPEEEQDLQLAHQRLLKLCQKCLEINVPLSVDAEDTSLQPAIDYFTYSAAIMYNKSGSRPVVYGTLQTYLKDARERLYLAVKTAEEIGVPMGFKLVRGAYMSSEAKLASSLGYDTPIHNTIEETHACFNDCASFMLENIVNGSTSVVLATHNIESGQMAAAKARELGIETGNRRLEFAQLYGMADALSFGLRNAGFQVSKYMPFGPVDKAMPYLLRRAEENRGLLSTSKIDRQLMRKELKRRIKSRIV